MPLLAGGQTNKNPLPLSGNRGQWFFQEDLKRIETFFPDQITTNQMPGTVFAISKKWQFSVFKPYEYLDKETQKPMTTDAIFNLASMTKVMATVGALTFY
jgi:CubicO group peptidase (beta-lactamase class C family)